MDYNIEPLLFRIRSKNFMGTYDIGWSCRHIFYTFKGTRGIREKHGNYLWCRDCVFRLLLCNLCTMVNELLEVCNKMKKLLLIVFLTIFSLLSYGSVSGASQIEDCKNHIELLCEGGIIHRIEIFDGRIKVIVNSLFWVSLRESIRIGICACYSEIHPDKNIIVISDDPVRLLSVFFSDDMTYRDIYMEKN